MKFRTIKIQVIVDEKHQRILEKLVDHLDLDMSKVIRLALRELAKKEKIK